MIVDEFIEQLEDDIKAYESRIKEFQQVIEETLNCIKKDEEKIREIKRVLPLLYVVNDEEKSKLIDLS